jgi:hypothetical protein
MGNSLLAIISTGRPSQDSVSAGKIHLEGYQQ